jgi:transposase-like protein
MATTPRGPGGRPPKYPAELKAVCVEAVLDEGRTIADVAREVNVTPQTLGKWVTAARADRPPAPPPEIPTLEGVTSLKPTGDSIADSRAIQQRLFRAAAEAEQLGNTSEARKNYQEAVKLSGVIARLERERDRDQGTIVTPDDITRARKSVQDQIDALRRRPLMCAKCHRELSLEVASGEKSE